MTDTTKMAAVSAFLHMSTRPMSKDDPRNGSNSPNSTSLTMLAEVKQGDRKAWFLLEALYRPRILYWCHRKGINGNDADDLYQEVLAAVATGIGGFERRSPGCFRKWLDTITYHKISDFYRGGENLISLEEMDDFANSAPDEQSHQHVLDPRFAEALVIIREGCSKKQWTAFWRMTVDQQPASKVKDELDMTERAVFQANYRVKKLVKEKLGGLI